jgi:hypothetical protein
MANSNFVVHNGLTVGPTTITASTGDINAANINASSLTTSGNISVANITAASFTTPGNITASNAVITNVTVTGTLTGNISASSVTATCI